MGGELARRGLSRGCMRGLLAAGLILTGLAALATPEARADANSSSNWAGYAAHRSGVRFRKVVGAWTQPSAACTPGRRAYSAYWVGLGGYSERSNALEQIGTELDCSARGRVESSAWYELVPAPSRTIRFRVRPGDQLAASVTVTGHQVTLALQDVTRGRAYTKTVHARTLDLGSADWIVEAPSDCVSAAQCRTLPLANFGAATFELALARASNGHVGPISDPMWSWSRISLRPRGRRYASSRGPATAAAQAIPSALSAAGTAFEVGYSAVAAAAVPAAAAQRGALLAGQLVHPLR